MTYEEAFDYIRSLSSMREGAIKEVLDQRIKEKGEFKLSDEDSGAAFLIRYDDSNGFTIDAVF